MDTKNKECTVSATQATSKQAESSEIESAPFSKDNDSGSLSSKETGKGTDDPLIAAASDGRTQGEKATIDAAVKNYEESHARFDDPVEPPARNAPKNFAAQELEALENDPSVTFLPMNTKSILTRLFDPDRKQKPQLWDHIKLVAPGPADQVSEGWASEILVLSKACHRWLNLNLNLSLIIFADKSSSRLMVALNGKAKMQ